MPIVILPPCRSYCVKYSHVIITVLTVTLLGVSCVKRNLPSDRDKQAQFTGKNYPHSTEFRLTAKHGPAFYEDATSCRSCHGEDYNGGKAKVGCYACHNSYPHTAEFRRCTNKEQCNHGRFYFVPDQRCQKCHKDETTDPPDQIDQTEDITKLLASTKPLSCQLCHDYPHPHKDNWATAKNQHGKKFADIWEYQISAPKKTSLAVTRLTCNDCHANQSYFRKKYPQSTITDCDKCHHLTIPHNDKFIETQHHSEHKKLTQSYLPQCQQCHLATDAKEPFKVKQYTRFFPKKLKRFTIEECLQCHVKDKVPKYATKETLIMNKTKKEACAVCHESKSLELIPVNSKDAKGNDLRSCAACHNPESTFSMKVEEIQTR
jgi:hypothetical protein